MRSIVARAGPPAPSCSDRGPRGHPPCWRAVAIAQTTRSGIARPPRPRPDTATPQKSRRRAATPRPASASRGAIPSARKNSKLHEKRSPKKNSCPISGSSSATPRTPRPRPARLLITHRSSAHVAPVVSASDVTRAFRVTARLLPPAVPRAASSSRAPMLAERRARDACSRGRSTRRRST